MTLPSEYDFLKDPTLDADAKKALLQGLLEEKKFAREAPIERTRFWHNTPLVLALVGTITIAANGIVSYALASRTTSDTVTLEQLKSQLKDSENRSTAARAVEASDADARRNASKDEREFAFRIIERELSKTGNSSERATVLLFLVRAGVLNSLNRNELEKMAESDIRKAGKDPNVVGIPPTLGRTPTFFYQLDNLPWEYIAFFTQASSEQDAGYIEFRTLMSAVSWGVRADVGTILKAAPSPFAKLTRPDGTPIWIKVDAVQQVVDTPPNTMADGVKSTIRFKGDTALTRTQGVKEEPAVVEERLKSAVKP